MPDAVNEPSHYTGLEGIEAKEIIKIVLDALPELSNWEAHCLATHLKYRLRAGDKGNVQMDIDKSNVYRDWYNISRRSEDVV